MSPSYTRDYPFVIARGEGAVVEDVDGNGSSTARPASPSTRPACRIPTSSRRSPSRRRSSSTCRAPTSTTSRRCGWRRSSPASSPIDGEVRTFFANSGTEATEAAIKLARYYTKRPGVIAFLGGFHGRSLGALSLTASKAIQRRGFGPFMPGVYHAPYPDTYRFNGSADGAPSRALAFIAEQILVHLAAPDEVAAIVVEPIQGEGGYVVPPPAFLQGLRELTTQHGMLLVVDEVQSGMGRTGKMFASEHFDLKADIVNIAKGIASGLPLGVTCARADVMTWPPGAHASTFGGNPVACAAANATIKLLKESLVDNAAAVGAHLMDGLRALQEKHPTDRRRARQGADDRHRAGARSRRPRSAPSRSANALVQAMFRRGVLVLGAGRNAMRLAPPLVLTRAQADSVARGARRGAGRGRPPSRLIRQTDVGCGRPCCIRHEEAA